MEINNALANGPFQSWVLTDQDEAIVFKNRGGQIEITGLPYYYFWNSNAAVVIRRQEALKQQALAALRAGNIPEHNRIAAQINSMVPTVEEVRTLTASMKAARNALRRFNPPVYTAATDTMQYAAFFRYVRRQNPEGWNRFLQQLQGVRVVPQVTTPTGWKR
jgi:hypothetical protein